MSQVGEALLQRDATLGQRGEDAVVVREGRRGPYLGGYRGQLCHALGQGAGTYDQHGVGEGRIVVPAVGLTEEVQAAEVLLDQRVELGGGMRAGIELAEELGQDGGVGQLLEGQATQVEVVVGVADPVSRQVMVEAGEGGLHLRKRPLLGRICDVVDTQAWQLGQVGGLVGSLLLRTQAPHLGDDRVKLRVREPLLEIPQFAGLLVCRARGGGHQLDGRAVHGLAYQPAQQPLEVAGLQARAHVVDGILVAQVVHGMAVVVEPAREDLHGEGDAIAAGAPVALAQVELGLGERCREARAVDPVCHEPAADVLHKPLEPCRHAGPGSLELEHGLGLELTVDQGGDEVVAQARVEDGALEG